MDHMHNVAGLLAFVVLVAGGLACFAYVWFAAGRPSAPHP
jgi:hypothetical protein